MAHPPRTVAPTVFIVDDDRAVRDALGFLVGSVGLAVKTYASADEFLSSYDPTAPGCLVLDVRMRGMSGLDLQAEMVRRSYTIPVIIVTGYGDVPVAVRAMKAGAVDLLQKPFSDQTLLDRVHAAIQLDQERRRARAEHEDLVARVAFLSPREREIAELLVQGKANKEIAADLGLSTRTVEGHRANIMDKLGTTSFADLVKIVLASRAER